MAEETIDDVKQAYALLFKAHSAVVKERDELASRVRELEWVLQAARDDLADWASYASPYFQEKHNLAGDLAAIDAALNASKEQL